MLLPLAIAALMHCCTGTEISTGCGFKDDITEQGGNFTLKSPGYPFILNTSLSCIWTITSNWSGTGIRFEITKIDLPGGVTLEIFNGYDTSGTRLYPDSGNTTVKSCINALTISYNVKLADIGKNGTKGGFTGSATKCVITPSDCCRQVGSYPHIIYWGNGTDCYARLFGYDDQIDIRQLDYGDDEDYILGFEILDHHTYAVHYREIFKFTKEHNMDGTRLFFHRINFIHKFVYFHSPSKSMKFAGSVDPDSDCLMDISVSKNGSYSYAYSPNYPNSYVFAMHCKYSIHTDDQWMVVEITVEENELTAGDTITICRTNPDPTQCDSDKVLRVITSRSQVNDSYASSSNWVDLYFSSGYPGKKFQKFKLRLQAIYPDSSFPCGSTTTMAGRQPAVLLSPGYPKVMNGSHTCVWILSVWPGTTIRFSIIDYRNPNGVTLKIYNGRQDTGDVIYPKGIATDIWACSGIATVVYKVDIPSFNASIHGGFYTKVMNDMPTSSCCLKTSTSAVVYRRQQKDCSVELIGQSRYVQLDNVQIKFRDDMDYIIGYTTDQYQMSGYKQAFRYSKNNTIGGNNLYLPWTYVTNSYIYFHSPSQALSFSGTIARTAGKCHETITLKTGSDANYLYSPNYPDKYIPSMDCKYDVNVPDGKIVSVTLEENNLAADDTVTICKGKSSYSCGYVDIMYKIISSTKAGQSYKSSQSRITIFFDATGQNSAAFKLMRFKLRMEPVTPSGLSTGAIVGIVIAGIVGVAFIVIIIAAVVVCRRNRAIHSRQSQPASAHYIAVNPQTTVYGQQQQYVQPQGGYTMDTNQSSVHTNL